MRNAREGNSGTEAEFPEATGQEIEVCRRVDAHDELGRTEAQNSHRDDGSERGRLREAAQRNQKQGENDVELLLHRQRPGVQQRHEAGIGREIIRLVPEEEIGREQIRRIKALAELVQFLRQHPHKREGNAGDTDEQKSRREPPGTTLIKSDDAECATADFLMNEGRDQETADHEENVDPRETTGYKAETGVKQQDGDYSDRAKPVDFRSVMHNARQKLS